MPRSDAGLRIGVTGHRSLPDDVALRERVQRVIQALVAEQPGPLAVVSALAEGADRLVAAVALDFPQSSLIAILPDEPAVYETDFATPESVEQFRAFLRRANAVTVVPSAGSRHANFEAAGHVMLEQIDVLIALWDGEPARGRGGTAEIVAAARATELPVIWIETASPFRVHDQPWRTGHVASRRGQP